MKELNYFYRRKVPDLYYNQGRLLSHKLLANILIVTSWSIGKYSKIVVLSCQRVSLRSHPWKLQEALYINIHVSTLVETRRRYFSVRGITLWKYFPSHLGSAEFIILFVIAVQISTHLGDRLPVWVCIIASQLLWNWFILLVPVIICRWLLITVNVILYSSTLLMMHQVQ